ncbi:conserved hypothetical protein (putative transposase or invertase) [Ectothiorhodospira magna]|uniref:Transposase n=1 Tax=Ectothiorhodospira magna TaxID=867345 RepID=A0A1H8ZCP6_9GAMM|nr:conserved hypothetical protein (putative transposase or invertase) [Ectothiorhodospira magna]
MAKVVHEPVKRAMSRIRELSADEEAQRLAFVRERALRDEVSLLNEARREGEQKGRQEGEEIGLQKGQRLTAINLLKLGVLTDDQIAQTTGLSLAEVKALQQETSHVHT